MKMKKKIILMMVLTILITSGIASAQNELPLNPPSGFYGDNPGPTKLWITGYQNEIRKDATTTYFESVTEGFSPFAISGITGITATQTPSVTQTPIPEITGTAMPPVKAPTVQNWILVVIIVAVYFFMIRKK